MDKAIHAVVLVCRNEALAVKQLCPVTVAVMRVFATRGRILSLLRRAQARMQPGILLPVSYRNMRWE